MRSFRRLLLPASVVLASLSLAAAEVKLPPLFSDHLVLQRSAKTPVWGTADPGEAVTLALGDVQAGATAGADGKWRADLDLAKAGDGPFTLVVAGKNKVEIQDVVVGEVWLASGQSNMEFSMQREAHAPAEIPQSADTGLRQFHVSNNAANAPAAAVNGKWTVAGPDATGGFTAVGYYFGKELRRSLHTPVGLISSTWGGTPIEAWTSAEALATIPALGDKAAQLAAAAAAYPGLQKDYVAALHAWQEKFQRQLPAPPADGAPQAAAEPAGEWKPFPVPGKLAAAGLPDAGVVWLRRTATLVAGDLASSFPIEIPGAGGTETVYWNGVKIGGGTLEIPPPETHRYYVPITAMKQGDNVVAIRLANPLGGLALDKVPHLANPGATSLADGWTAQAEVSLPPAPDAAAEYPKPPPQPAIASSLGSTLYNGMIAPLIPYALGGAIWYQGENNTGRGFQYRVALPLLIGDWRGRWGSDFPFYVCQLPNFGGKAAQPGESNWAELRESQAKTMSLPNTGLAVLIDAGEEADIHPKDKALPGARLARAVLAKVYGQTASGPGSGPVFRSATVEGDKIRVAFDGGGALAVKPLPADYAPSSLLPQKRVPLARHVSDGEVEGFAVCGADHKWVWADARVDGATVVAWSPQVPQPVAVRYAWANNPTCNLYDEAGLPVAPFRSDDFPLSTEKVSW